MNLKLRDVIYTSSDGNKFWKINEEFIRGNNINSIQFKEGLLEKIEEDKQLRINMPEITNTSRNIVTVAPSRAGTRGRGTPQRGRGAPTRGRGGNFTHRNIFLTNFR